MRICAIDSSGLVASVAITDDEQLIAEYSIQYKITHSQTLLPMLDEIRKRIDFDLATIDAYAQAAGPGSFTGLRIGAATIKGLGIAIDRPVVSVPTLEALAYNAYGVGGLVCPIMDARRHQVYTGVYEYKYSTERHKYELVVVRPQVACEFNDLCHTLNELGRDVMFIGDGIPVYSGEMEAQLTIPYSLAPAQMNRQKAGALAALAYEYMNNNAAGLEGKITSVDDAALEYLRMAQAEREKKEREGEA